MYYGKRKYSGTNRRDDIAKTIIKCPEKSYAQIADEYCISENTVRRIAAEYDIGRNPRKY